MNPGAVEVCDPADVDEDCNGLADDLDPAAEGKVSSPVDADGDGMVTQAEIEAAREAHGGRHGKSARE